ncbi:MAG: nicotinamide-nucleotide amidohydrolase family protein [Chromatiales bacterium]|nr:nicotinamide-nucleotide amidohydrolase family protein [Chromatiales bacterium]
MREDNLLAARVAELAELLAARGLKLTTAESCTGGWLAKCLTDRPGSSAWFEFGFVTYGNNAKHALLGVREQTLKDHGAVSQQVAEEMAIGARRASGADLAVAITGIAGPDGGTDAKPVGTVWLAWAGPDGKLGAEKRELPGDRAAVRSQAVAEALDGTIARVPR